jgi:hypothetical protein
MGLNALKVPMKWSMVEPRRGVYDFSYLDRVKRLAEQHHLKLILNWFALCQRRRDDLKIDVNPATILAKRILIIVLSLVILLYGGDYLSLRLRMLHPKPADPFETFTSLRILAIPEKNGKTEYETDIQNPQQTITCVHSLFPHAGYSPCWYIKPKLNQPIPM